MPARIRCPLLGPVTGQAHPAQFAVPARSLPRRVLRGPRRPVPSAHGPVPPLGELTIHDSDADPDAHTTDHAWPGAPAQTGTTTGGTSPEGTGNPLDVVTFVPGAAYTGLAVPALASSKVAGPDGT
jgi:hypothetical protein